VGLYNSIVKLSNFNARNEDGMPFIANQRLEQNYYATIHDGSIDSAYSKINEKKVSYLMCI
jgi:hypothetical protein